MKHSLRIVLDTNVLVSALFFKTSLPRQAFEKAAAEAKVLISLATYAEVSEVLSRPKFTRYLSEADRLQFLAKFINLAIPVEIKTSIQACRDPKDDKFLEVAVNGQADLLVTGDKDLLVLHPFQGV
jgi:putative PIN family toxin of toxin-antitoxin system